MRKKANHFCSTKNQQVSHVFFILAVFCCFLLLHCQHYSKISHPAWLGSQSENKVHLKLPTGTDNDMINMHYWPSMRSRLDLGHILFLHFYWLRQSQHSKIKNDWFVSTARKKKLKCVCSTINPWESFKVFFANFVLPIFASQSSS